VLIAMCSVSFDADYTTELERLSRHFEVLFIKLHYFEPFRVAERLIVQAATHSSP
jgi:hypothetical protein